MKQLVRPSAHACMRLAKTTAIVVREVKIQSVKFPFDGATGIVQEHSAQAATVDAYQQLGMNS